jgi:exodeoxyribonuclease VII small subunit
VGGVKFEQAMARLEAIVGELEKGDLPLDESLKIFEEGIRLSKSCLKILEPNAKWKCSSRIETARKDFMRSHRTKKPKNPPTSRLVEFEVRPFSHVPSWFSFDSLFTSYELESL